jgi:hypothetical protein
LGDSTKRTYDAANVEHRNWWENTLQPLAQEVADQINLELAPRLGDEIGWFDFSKVTALQSDSRLLALGANIPLLVGPDKPIASSELRHELGLPDVRPPDTDEEIAQAKEAKAQAAAIASAGPTDPNAPGKGAPGPKPAPGVKNAPDITPTGPGIGAGREGNLETRGRRAREIRQIEYRKIDSTVRNLEPIFEGVMKSVFEKQQRSVMAKFNARGGRLSRRDSNAEKAAEDAHASDTLKKLFDGDYWDAEIAALLSPHYTNVAAAAAEHLSGKIGVSFDVHNPQVAAFIRSRANLLAGNVNQTTYDAIANAMAEGQEAGDSIPMIAGRIQDVFEDASNTRATMIARTEVIGSFNGSTHEIGQLLPDGMVAGEEWLATEDDRTREAHIEADGQQIAMGDVFSVDGEDMRYPGDPNGSPENVINCRCALVLLTPDEFNAPDDDDERSYNLEDLREQLLTEA